MKFKLITSQPSINEARYHRDGLSWYDGATNVFSSGAGPKDLISSEERAKIYKAKPIELGTQVYIPDYSDNYVAIQLIWLKQDFGDRLEFYRGGTGYNIVAANDHTKVVKFYDGSMFDSYDPVRNPKGREIRISSRDSSRRELLAKYISEELGVTPINNQNNSSINTSSPTVDTLDIETLKTIQATDMELKRHDIGRGDCIFHYVPTKTSDFKDKVDRCTIKLTVPSIIFSGAIVYDFKAQKMKLADNLDDIIKHHLIKPTISLVDNTGKKWDKFLVNLPEFIDDMTKRAVITTFNYLDTDTVRTGWIEELAGMCKRVTQVRQSKH